MMNLQYPRFRPACTLGDLLRTMPVLLLCVLAMHTACALPIGGIVNIKPKIEVRAEKSKGWTVAGERYTLAYGDYLRTDKNGKADILFNNGTEIVMRGNTQIQIVAPASADKPLVVRVFGALSEIFVRAKGNTEIRTAASNAAVRGTQFLIRLPDEKTTTLTVAEGIVDFYNAQGRVTVYKDQQSTATVGQPPSPPIAVDVTGLLMWTADIATLPIDLEMPMLSLDPEEVARQRQRWETELNANPANLEARRQLARALYDSWQYSAAIQEFGEVVKRAPNDVQAYLELGAAYRAGGDAVNAAQTYARALALSPGNIDAQLGFALTMIAKGDLTAARGVLDAITGEPRADTLRGLLELRAGHPEVARQHLTTAVDEDPTGYQAFYLLALTRLTLNQLPEAEAAARKATVLQPFSAQAQATLALVLFFEQQTAEATVVATRAVQLNPLSPYALLTKGRMLLAQGALDEARNTLQQAQTLAPDLPLVHAELGHVYLRLGLIPKAETAFRTALSLRVVSPDAHAGLGACLALQGRTPDAIAEYHRALAIDPTHAGAHIGLAAIYTEQGQLAHAEAELQLAAAEQPAHGVLYARLAVIALYRQQLFQAQLYAQRAVSLLPNSAITHFVLGQVYQEQGRTLQAGNQFRLAATLDPQYAPARYALGVIRESVETGMDLSHPLGAITAANTGSPGQNINIQNLQSPGAGDRIQAAIFDPTVIRVASRSFGDTQLDGTLGDRDTRTAGLSYIHETANRQSVFSLLGRHDTTDGVRENADRSNNQLGISGGWKSWNSPSGLFAMANYRHMDRGNDDGLTSNPFLATSRTQWEIPSLLIGGNVWSSASQRTSALLLLERPWDKTTDMMGHTAYEIDSAHGEIRHDVAFRNHRISLGMNLGSRKQQLENLLSIGIPGLDILSETDFRVDWTQVYLHDSYRWTPTVSMFGDVKFSRLTTKLTNSFLTPPPPMSTTKYASVETVLPSFTVSWQPTVRNGFRVRAQGIAGSIDDFQLLNPTEVFIFDTSYLPTIRLSDMGYHSAIARGHSYEAEYDHTLTDSSFLRIGVLDQRIRNTKNAAGEFMPRSHFRSANLRFEKVLTPTITGLIGMSLIDANAITDIGANDQVSSNAEISGIPRYTGEFGVQYLTPRGWFAQGAIGIIGPRMQPYQQNSSNPRVRDDAFMITNIRLGKRAGLRSTLFLEVENLFDARYTVITNGYNQLHDGRQIRLGVSQRF